MHFRYKAKNRNNEQIEGLLDAESESRAAEMLLERQLAVIELKEIQTSGIMQFLGTFFLRVSKKDLAIFLRQLSILVSAAVPLVNALKILAEQSAKGGLKEALGDVVNEVEGGTKLSVALNKYPSLFNSYFVNMIKSGETSGRLDEIMNYLADQQEKDYELQSKLVGALSYPIFIIIMMVIASFVMFVFVLPKMLTMFTDMGPGVELPIATRMLIGTSWFFTHFWWLIILIVLGGIIGFSLYVRTPGGRYVAHYVLLKLPVFGKLFTYVSLVRFSRSLGTILVGGITIPMGLRVVRDIVGNAVYEDVITQTIKEVEDGNPVSTAFARSHEVPPMVTHMISVGEQTGRLDDVLDKVSKFYGREVDVMLENVISLIEPVIMVLLGLGVGVMVAGILLPMYTLSSKM